MSGFFVDLLSRSRGTADVVRPRLTSLFEPGAQPVAHANGASPADAQRNAPVTMASAGPAPIIWSARRGVALARDAGSSRSAPHARHGHDGPPYDAQDAGADSDADAALGPHRRDSEGWDAGDDAVALAAGTRLSAGPAGGSADSRRKPGDRGTRADQADRTAAAASTAAGGPVAVADVAGTDWGSTSGTGVMSASALRARLAHAVGMHAGAARRSDGSSGSHGAADGNALLAADTTTAALLAAARPPASLAAMPVPASTSRHDAGATASRSRAEADAREPVIEISIGRIDVRAAVARGSDRKASSSPAVMGLEEYLQTHARARGGSR
jgi:hypothetical protein